MTMSFTGSLEVDKSRNETERARLRQKAIQLADTGLASLAFVILFAQDALRAVFGDALGVAIATLICVLYSIRLLRNWRSVRWMRMPLMLVLFLLASGLSLLWSGNIQTSLVAWAIALATSGAAIGMTMLLPWTALVKALGTALRWVVGLGFVLEAVAVFITHGPLWVLTGHRDMLSFAALALLIVLPLQLAERTVWRGWAYIWILIALATLAFTQSMPSWLALIFVLIVRGLIEWARATNPIRRRPLYVVVFGLLVGIVVSLLTSWSQFAEVTSRGSWVIMVSTLSTAGVIFLVGLIVTTYWRSWFVAVDRPQWDLDTRRPFTATSMLPVLLTTALVVSGAFTDWLTSESGLLLLVICAVVTKYPERLRGDNR
jgi:exopolysaccharide production protein ExoQ